MRSASSSTTPSRARTKRATALTLRSLVVPALPPAVPLVVRASIEINAVAADAELAASVSLPSADAETFAEQPASSPTRTVVAAKETFRMSAGVG